MWDSPDYRGEGIFDEDLLERHELALSRIGEIPDEKALQGGEEEYFRRGALFFLSPDYSDALPEKYAESFRNPSYAVKVLGEGYGELLSHVAYESLNIIPFRAEKRLFDEVILLEEFLELYCLYLGMEKGEKPGLKNVKEVIRSTAFDYMEHSVSLRIRSQIDPSIDFARRIIMEEDLSNPSYLEKFGEYVDDDTRKIWEFLSSRPDSEIEAMAETFTEGFRKGFITTGKDISKKSIVNIRYKLGFERVVRSSVRLFKKMGLRCTFMRRALYAVNRNSSFRVGYSGAYVNRQMDFDHRDDKAIFVDKAFAERKLEIIEKTYEEYKGLAGAFAGPAVMDTFGEEPFSPVFKKEALRMTRAQQNIMLGLSGNMGKITNRFIPGDERSYTIISYPVPKIGPFFEDIFRETIKINTLEYDKYRDIQQKLILTLEKGTKVRVRGKNGNKTDITVSLHKINDKERETVFENCVADVNIPVGEVFTSPSLPLTEGILHVSEVYLNGLRYENLEFKVEGGFIKDYNCTNFETEKDNKDYIRENILHNHETLPIGEFAIGTNTLAYSMAKKYNIFSKLEILIAEKTGPHFAFGDTCYSREEDIRICNPDGREMIARDNEYTEKRKTDSDFNYFECHTDVTIPYDELDSIVSVDGDGNEYPVIMNGRFAVPGSEELNDPLI